MRRLLKYGARQLGLSIKRVRPPEPTKDMSAEFAPLFELCHPYTMTPIGRMYGLFQSVKYMIERNILGDIVECGVWRGGSAMLVAKYLASINDTPRRIFLYDTYEGMSEPTSHDRIIATDESAHPAWDSRRTTEDTEASDWCFASLDDVKANMSLTGYPNDKLIYVKGKVEDSIPESLPQEIAILRLDTDWYESTKHTMQHLFPLLAPSGVLILDDYGCWAGARRAVDEYLTETRTSLLLNRIDYSCRVAVKA